MIIFKSYYFVRRKYWRIRWYIGYYIYWPLKDAIYWPIKIFLMDKWWEHVNHPIFGFKVKFKAYREKKFQDFKNFLNVLMPVVKNFFVLNSIRIFRKIQSFIKRFSYKLFIFRHKYFFSKLPPLRDIPSVRATNYFLLWILASLSSYLNSFSLYKEKIYNPYIVPIFKSFSYDSQQISNSQDPVEANRLGFQKIDKWLNEAIKLKVKIEKQKLLKLRSKIRRVRRSIYIVLQPKPPKIYPREETLELEPRVPTRYQEIAHYIFIRWNRLRIFVMATFLMFKFHLLRLFTVYSGYAFLAGFGYRYWIKFRYSLRFGSAFSEYIAFLWPLLILCVFLYYVIGFIIVHFFLTPFFPGFVFGWRMYLGLVLLWFATLEHFAFSDWSQFDRDQRNDYFVVRRNRFLEHFPERTDIYDFRDWEKMVDYQTRRRKGIERFVHFRGVYYDHPPLF